MPKAKDMSAINSLLPNTSTSTSQTGNVNGFSSLTPADFIKMMVTQLQNQDPLNPTNSQDILSQMSEIGQLQSSSQLQTSLTGLTLQNQIGAASSLIGKSVQGIDSNNNAVTGNVTGVTISQVPAAQSPTGAATTTVTLNLDSGGSLPLGNVTAIAPPVQAATIPATTPTTPTTTQSPTTGS
jgi:flagellar basal-body rod modification protein FlgD